MQVKEIMSEAVDLVDPGASVQDAAKRMRDDNVGALPVGENDRLVGMVTDRDIVMRAVADGHDISGKTVRDVMSAHVMCCFEEDSLERASEIMAEHQIRRLPVLSANKRLTGMLALADVARSDAAVAGRAVSGVSQQSNRPRS